MGLDVVLFTLPFHGLRSPRGLPSGMKFPGSHIVRTNEGFAHALRDLRVLVSWLYERGAPEVGAMGMSLGGYTAALLATAEPRLSFAVPMIPVTSLSGVMWGEGADRPGAKRAEAAGITREALDAVFEIHAPLVRRALIPTGRQLIIAGLGDRIAPPEQARRLHAHWGEPRLHWYPGGHLAQFGRKETFAVLRSFLIDAGVIPARPRFRAAG
jgi:pimeloyl-ACP methyl ester carboxylesterase